MIGMSLPRVRVTLGAYNGKSPSIEAHIRRVQKYIDDSRAHFEKTGTTEQEYRAWAMKVMAGALKNMADVLSTE